MADRRGFRGEEQIVTPFRRAEVNTPEKALHNLYIAQVRWRIEAVFSRLKSFPILAISPHSLSQHRLVFLTAVQIYNIDVVYHQLSR